MLVNLKVRIKYIFASNAISYAAGTLVLLRAQDVYSEAFYLVLYSFIDNFETFMNINVKF